MTTQAQQEASGILKACCEKLLQMFTLYSFRLALTVCNSPSTQAQNYSKHPALSSGQTLPS